MTSTTFHSQLLDIKGSTDLSSTAAGSTSKNQTPINEWLAAIGTKDFCRLERRLGWDNLTGEVIGFIPSMSMRTAGSRQPWDDRFCNSREWLKQAAPINTANSEELHRTIYRLPVQIPTFVELWHLIAEGAKRELQEKLSNELITELFLPGEKEGGDPQPIVDLMLSLTRRLSIVGEQVLWYEFNACRTPGQMLLVHMNNSVRDDRSSLPKTAYLSFLESLRRDGLRQICTKYPVLPRHLSTVVESWIDSSHELLTRIHKDISSLRSEFCTGGEARLSQIKQDISDLHKSGRGVAILSFKSKAEPCKETTIVYKPRDLRLDAVYQSILRDISSPKYDLPLRSLLVLTRHEYGYIEYVPHIIASNDAELASFYRNAGRLSAILFLLGCTDCHHSNLIASGDQLILIDTETLLEGLPNEDSEEIGHRKGPPISRTQSQLNRSLMRSGLLPEWVYIGESKLPRDLSALGIEPPQASTTLEPGWLFKNTDGMMPGRIDKPVKVSTSSPVDIGSANRLSDFIKPFCDGLRDQLFCLSADKDIWLKPGGLLSRFNGLKRRIVLRATRVYLAIQQQQLSPIALSSEWMQGMRLEQLARSFLLSDVKPSSWPIFAAEILQMEHLDIPYFEHFVDSRDITLPTGAHINDFLGESGIEKARNEFLLLDKSAIEFQLQVVAGMIAARKLRKFSENTTSFSKISARLNYTASESERIDEVIRLAGQIEANAMKSSEGTLEWMGVDIGSNADKFRFGMLGNSLYSGKCGIAAFMLSLSIYLREKGDKYQSIALNAMFPLVQHLSIAHVDSLRHWWRDQPLGLTGCGGQLLTLQQLCRRIPEASSTYREIIDRINL